MALFGVCLSLSDPIAPLTHTAKRAHALGSVTRVVMHRLPDPRRSRFASLLKVALFFLWLIAPTWLRSATISGTIKDPSGAVIPGARIEITGET